MDAPVIAALGPAFSAHPSWTPSWLGTGEPWLVASLVLVGLVLIAGSALQSAAGFGFGMFAIPLVMVIGGRSGPEAITIVGVCGAVQMAIGTWHHRRDVDWRQLAVMGGLASLFIPVGVVVLGRLSEEGPELVRRVFGAIILLALAMRLAIRPAPRPRLAAGWMVLAVSAGGVMTGLAGMGGPPVVLWVMAHDWPGVRARATLWAYFLLMTPVQIGLLWARFGLEVPEAALEGLILAPLCLLGIYPGLWLGRRLSKPQLRWLATSILAIVGASAVAG